MSVLAPRHDPDITDNLCFAKYVLQFINHIKLIQNVKFHTVK